MPPPEHAAAGWADGGVAAAARARGRVAEAAVAFRHTVVSPGAASSPIATRRIDAVVADVTRGPLPPYTSVSVRIAPQLAGFGLLEAIPTGAIRRRADPDDRDLDGISGRVGQVRMATEGLGRFGWRAEAASIEEQVIRALATDMGVQGEEIDRRDVDRLAAFVRLLAPPVAAGLAGPDEAAGAKLFTVLRCDRCHVPSWTTARIDGAPELSGRVIRPYTDLLLHDMGGGLADRRLDGSESTREWRTPPLWGLGQTLPSDGGATEDLRLMHDGRARTVLEAVAWHGGEAAESRRRTLGLDVASRTLLERFVRGR